MFKRRKPSSTKPSTQQTRQKQVKFALYCLYALALWVLAYEILWGTYAQYRDMGVEAQTVAEALNQDINTLRSAIALSPTASAATQLPDTLRAGADFIENIKTAEDAKPNSELGYAAKLANTAEFQTLGHAVAETGKLIVGNTTKNKRYVIAQIPFEAILTAHLKADSGGVLASYSNYEFGKAFGVSAKPVQTGVALAQSVPFFTQCASVQALTDTKLCILETIHPLQLRTILASLLKLLALLVVVWVINRLRNKPKPSLDARQIAKDLDTHDVAYWQYDGQAFLMNNAATTRLGLVIDETIPIDRFLGQVSQQYHGSVLESFRNGMKDGFVQIEIPFNIRGKIIWMTMEGHGILSNGTPVLAGTFHNISHIYARMMEAGSTSNRLQEALNLYAGPFALWDAQQRLIFWNGPFERDFGLSGRIQVGQTYDRVSRRRASAVKSEVMVEAEPDAIVFELFSDKFIKVIERRVPNQGMVSLGVDITENVKNQQALSSQQENLKSMVRKLEQSEGRASELTRKYAEEKKKAQRAAKSKTDFLSNMSHELRTPLNAINGFSEMIHTEIFGPVGDPRYKEYAGDILASGQHLLEMINDILDMAKIEAGKMTINPQLLDPLDPVKAAMRMIHGRARENGLKLLFMGAKDLPEIRADHRAIRQMVLNLASNAIKFTPYGGEVRVRVDHGHSGIVFAVEDTGVGIPKNEIGRLAKPFEQASTTQDADHEGTGLGLALTKAFTDLHNGKFYIESEVGVGTIIAFELPIDPDIGLASEASLENLPKSA